MTWMIGTLTWVERKERSLALIEKLFIRSEVPKHQKLISDFLNFH